MIQFFSLFPWSLAASPFGAQVRRLGITHRFSEAPVNLRYRSKVAFLLGTGPRVAWFALRSAVQSLVLGRSAPPPDAAVFHAELAALVFGVVQRLLPPPLRRGHRTLVVLQTFIATPRHSPLANAAFMLYYWTLLACIDVAVCHSRAEMANYERLFPSARHKLVHVPFGMTVNRPRAPIAMRAHEDDRNAPVISAGRSGRDYATLVEAIRGLPCRLQIICDSAAPLAGIRLPDQVEVIRDCFEEAYIEALSRACFVVVPLSANDISAGQMVLLQAGALAKGTVITRTATTPEYATDGENALLVEKGNVEQMRDAIRRLLEDGALRARLGANAALRFERDHSTEAYVRNLVAAIEATLKSTRPARGDGGPCDATPTHRAARAVEEASQPNKN